MRHRLAARYAIFDPKTQIFSYYASEHDAKMNRERKGAVTVAQTILYAERFAFYTDGGRFYECFAETAHELHMWMDALPAPTGAKVEGWVYKHKRGAHSAKFQRRYATYEMETGMFNYFTDHTRSVPKGRATVLYAVPNRSGRETAPPRTLRDGGNEGGTQELTFRTEDGKFFDVIVETAYTGGKPGEGEALSELQITGVDARDAWIAALPQPPSYAMRGWVIERLAGLMASKRRR